MPDPGFWGDQGEGDPALLAALAAYAAEPGRSPAVVWALSRARVLVPVVAVLTEAAEAGAGPGRHRALHTEKLRREKSTDMALVTIAGPDGRRALPVFTSLASLAAWRADARPVPVEAVRAAVSAAAEGAEALVIDPAGPTRYAVAGPLLRVLAQGDVEPPLWDDPAARDAVLAALGVPRAVPGLRGVCLEPAAGADARVVLLVEPGADVAEVVRTAAPRLQSCELLRRRTYLGLDVAVAED